MREKVLLSNLKTLFVCPSEKWGTIERKALSDSLIQRDLGANPIIYCLKNSKLDLEAQKWDLETIYYSGKKVNRILDFRYYLHLRKIEKKLNFDIIHSYSLDFIWEICFLLLTRPHIPLLFTFNEYLNNPQKSFFQNWLFRRVDQVLVFSQTMKETVQETLPVSNRKIKISGNGVEEVKKDIVRDSDMTKNINTIVTSISDLNQVQTLIFAMKSINMQSDELLFKVNLNIYSMTGIEKFDNYEKTIELVHDNNLSQSIHFHKITNEADAFKQADIFVGTAFNEPFNDYEMMAIISNIPVLVPRTASRQFMLNRYKWTGESYYFSDAREVKTKLLKILMNDQVYLNELQDQQQSFRDSHGIDSYISRFCGFYERNYSKRTRYARSKDSASL